MPLEAEVVVLQDNPTVGMTQIEVHYLPDQVNLSYAPPTVLSYAICVPLFVFLLGYSTWLMVIVFPQSILTGLFFLAVNLAMYYTSFMNARKAMTYQIVFKPGQIEYHRKIWGLHTIKSIEIDSIFIFVTMRCGKVFDSINLGLCIHKSGSRRPRSLLGPQCIHVMEPNQLKRVMQMSILLERVSELTGIPIRRDGRLHCSSGRYFPWPL